MQEIACGQKVLMNRQFISVRCEHNISRSCTAGNDIFPPQKAFCFARMFSLSVSLIFGLQGPRKSCQVSFYNCLLPFRILQMRRQDFCIQEWETPEERITGSRASARTAKENNYENLFASLSHLRFAFPFSSQSIVRVFHKVETG